MVTDWPRNVPGTLDAAVQLGEAIQAATNGRLRIEVSAAGEVVRPFETFDAVAAGLADMYHSADYYFESKSPGFTFFAAVPFGLTAQEHFAWVRYGGGQALWDSLSGEHGIKPILCGSTGSQMGGWFTNEISSAAGFRGLRYRMPGLGGEVLRRMGATVVNVPGGEIRPALRSGALDASEWVGPWADMALGLHEVAGFYYYPGFHEPGTALTLGVNKGIWESFSPSDRRLIEGIAAGEFSRSLAQFNANNAIWLTRLRDLRTVQIRRFDDAVLRSLVQNSRDVVAEAGAYDSHARLIAENHGAFRTSIRDWSDVAERAFLNARGLD
ncbi:TRAP transporter substrate-binding protein [Roseomonas sp. AR75]|uniref:TRAP transporter substrate-binding protein n=1 Tax=Roseomonas sp. AR75 TaxID=2562311 RepID=UPI001F0F330F|nr:TRAP transporter substrate-binding protein [Roseomonas sp. AR75]